MEPSRTASASATASTPSPSPPLRFRRESDAESEPPMFLWEDKQALAPGLEVGPQVDLRLSASLLHHGRTDFFFLPTESVKRPSIREWEGLGTSGAQAP